MNEIQAARELLRNKKLPEVSPPNQVGINKIRLMTNGILDAVDSGLNSYETQYPFSEHVAAQKYLFDIGWCLFEENFLYPWFKGFLKNALLSSPKVTARFNHKKLLVTVKFTWE